MATKLLLASAATMLMLTGTAFAQIQTQTDDRFAPRTYGSTAVTPADYGQTQRQTVRVVEPVTQDFQTTIFAAPTYTEGDIVRAQHFKPGDLSDAEYQALLDEADRIRAYQASNGYVSDGYTAPTDGYISDSYTVATNGHISNSASVVSSGTTYDVGTTTVYPANGDYEIELFAPETADIGTVTYAETTPVQTSTLNSFSTQTHNVLRGDTLYNISKRYNVSVESLKSANYMSDNNIGIGQVLTIPAGTTIVSENSYVAPITATSANTNLTYIRNVEPLSPVNSGIYAVLPKDTLYSISRRACVRVTDLIAVNGISSPNAIKPGQRLTMPQGHCLN